MKGFKILKALQKYFDCTMNSVNYCVLDLPLM